MTQQSARFPRLAAITALALSAALVYSGCGASTEPDPVPAGTDMWASESISNFDSAKRVTVNILNELAGLAPEDSRLPKESQPPEPGSIPVRLLSCEKPHHFMYPGATAVIFSNEEAATAFEATVNNHMRAQGGWLEQSTPDENGNPEPQFVSHNGFAVSASYSEYRGTHVVGITAFSPCFEMPEDFNANTTEL